MFIWHGFSEAEEGLRDKAAALSIGTFDGVHLGHQAVIAGLCREARRRSLLPMVMTFESHPSSAVGREAPPLIIPLQRRLELLDSLGLESALVVPFDESLAARGPEEFIRDCLHHILRVRLMVVGHDFRFGAGGAGDAGLLAALGRPFGLDVMTVPAVMVDGAMVSSTAIRWALAAGEVAAARRFLGRPFSVRGEVVSGEKRGRSLGFPTANLRLDPGVLWPRYGVYLVDTVIGAERCHGVANVGVRPTFGGREPGIEVFLLERSFDLYNTDIEVFFLRFLRPEQCFATAGELRARIELDVAQARRLLAEGCLEESRDHARSSGKISP